jgi:hypothetical protein
MTLKVKTTNPTGNKHPPATAGSQIRNSPVLSGETPINIGLPRTQEQAQNTQYQAQEQANPPVITSPELTNCDTKSSGETGTVTSVPFADWGPRPPFHFDEGRTLRKPPELGKNNKGERFHGLKPWRTSIPALPSRRDLSD